MQSPNFTFDELAFTKWDCTMPIDVPARDARNILLTEEIFTYFRVKYKFGKLDFY